MDQRKTGKMKKGKNIRKIKSFCNGKSVCRGKGWFQAGNFPSFCDCKKGLKLKKKRLREITGR